MKIVLTLLEFLPAAKQSQQEKKLTLVAGKKKKIHKKLASLLKFYCVSIFGIDLPGVMYPKFLLKYYIF